MFMHHFAFKRTLASAALAMTSINCSAAEPGQSKWATMEDAKMSVSFRIQAPDGNAVDGSSKVVFTNKYAVSALRDPDARYGQDWDSFVLFDLEKMAWYDVGHRQWVDLKSCRDWEKASIDRTKADLSKSPDAKARAFVEAMIDPRLELQKREDGVIVIFNSHVSYSIVPAENVTPNQLDRFVAYDRLNAYHKAINERQLPPTIQIAVDSFFAEQRIFPKQLTVRIKTAKGDVIATTDTRMDTFDPSDAELIQRELAKSQQ